MYRTITNLGRALAMLDSNPSMTWDEMSPVVCNSEDTRHTAKSSLVTRYGLAAEIDGEIRITDRGRARMVGEDAIIDFMIASAGKTVPLIAVERALRDTPAKSMTPRLIVRILQLGGAVKVSRRCWRMPDVARSVALWGGGAGLHVLTDSRDHPVVPAAVLGIFGEIPVDLGREPLQDAHGKEDRPILSSHIKNIVKIGLNLCQLDVIQIEAF